MLPAVLPVGTHMFEVRTTDMHGQVYVDRESIRVVAPPQPAPPARPRAAAAGAAR